MDKKRLAFAGGTFSAAMAIGFVMQNTDALAALDTSQDAPQVVVQTASLTPAVATPTQNLEAPALDVAADVEAPVTEVVVQAEPAANCGVSLNLRPQPAAVLQGIVSAPCEANSRGTVHHEGMMFSFVTDAIGSAEFEVPALATSATVIIAFGSGEGAMAQRDVPSLSEYDRVVVQWRGETGASLHAFERGADYGDAGHVWSGAARNATITAMSDSGFLMQLGHVETSNPFKAEVYTFPSKRDDFATNVEVAVETEVLAQTCGREVEAQTIHVSPVNARLVHDLTLAMPECDAVGDYVVMAAPISALQFASR